jgi:hypothetical protein
MTAERRRAEDERGNAILEFALVISFLGMLLFGTFSVGMTLTKSVQAGVVSRDAGAMFMRQVDFTLAQNKNIVVRLANGMGMTTSGGNGAVVLTKVLKIGTPECAAGGLGVGACPNFDQAVVIKRIVIGNSTLFTSSFGTPTASLIQADGDLSVASYLTDVTARVPNFSSIMTLNAGEHAYVSEAYFLTPEVNLPGYRSNTYVYQRNIF